MPVENVNIVALAAVVLGFLTILIPIAGFTLRYAIKPVTEALRASREGSAARDTIQMLERRMALLEQEVHSVTELRADIARVLEDVEFQKQLKSKT